MNRPDRATRRRAKVKEIGEPPFPDLLPHHQQLLLDSAITAAVARARGYRSITDSDEDMRWLAHKGFSKNQRRPGLAFQLHRPNGESGGWRLRPDAPRLTEPEGKPVKYESAAGSANVLDVSPLSRADLKRVGSRST